MTCSSGKQSTEVWPAQQCICIMQCSLLLYMLLLATELMLLSACLLAWFAAAAAGCQMAATHHTLGLGSVGDPDAGAGSAPPLLGAAAVDTVAPGAAKLDGALCLQHGALQ
jgi:hypothetical protein